MPLTYPGGWAAAIDRYEARRAPLNFAAGEALPPPDVDLVPLCARLVPDPGPIPDRPSSFARKRHALATELQGQPELMLLHAVLIATLRKRAWPAQAPGLFRRIWTEQGDWLCEVLPSRWLISAAITFADHGETEGERHLGQSMKVLFSLLKLTEFERLYSGLAPDTAFPVGQRIKADLPMGIEPFSLRDGGLDINLLAPMVQAALEEPVLGKVALALLDRLNADPGTVFRRLSLMREELLQRKR